MTQSRRHGFSLAKAIGGGLAGFARLVSLPFGPSYGARISAHASNRLAPIVRIKTPRGAIRYRCPSAAAVRQAARLLTREPDTIGWLEEYVKSGDHLWDIGANIGLYSVYACLREDVTATAFEPVIGNLDVLASAIMLNGLGVRIVPLAMGISDRTGVATIYLIDADAGSGLHALDQPSNVRGAFEPAGSFTVAVIRAEDAIAKFGLRAPSHIKIDVDGHELRVLEGLRAVLPGARTVWIEMTDDAQASGDNAKIEALLAEMDFAPGALASGLKGENRLFLNRRV